MGKNTMMVVRTAAGPRPQTREAGHGVALDGGEHHVSGVEQHPDPEGKAAEGHHVQRQAAKIHDEEGGQNGDGEDRHEHEGAAKVAKDQDQRKEGEACSRDDFPGNVHDGAGNEAGFVVHDPDFEFPLELSLQILHDMADVRGGLDGVLARLLVKGGDDAFPAVVAGESGALAVTVLHGGERSEQDGYAVVVPADDGLPDIFDGGELPEGADEHVLRADGDVAGREVHVGVFDGVLQLFGAQIVGGEESLVHFDGDLFLVAAGELDKGHAVDGRTW